MSTRFDPQPFFTQTQHVALCVAASEVFGMLARSLALPAAWAALVTRTGGDQRFVPAGGRVDGTDAAGVLFVRTTPFEVTLTEEGLVTRDKFQCRAELRLSVSVVPERSELSSFQRTVLGSHRVGKCDAVARFLQPLVRSALAEFAAGRSAADAVTALAAEELSAAVREAAQSGCFAAGMSLENVLHAQLTSPQFQNVQRVEEDAARRRAEHEATQQVEEALRESREKHLDQLTALLDRLSELSRKSPDVELPELIRTFTEKQRGELYEALFAAETPTARTQSVVIAASDEVVFFDAESPAAPRRRVPIQGPAGPIRSIQSAADAAGRSALLLGAATGVYRLAPDGSEPDALLLLPDPPLVRGGFNAVATEGEWVLGTHSELGICDWHVGDAMQGHAPTIQGRRRFEDLTRGAKAVRGASSLNGNFFVSVDDRVIQWRAGEDAVAPAAVFGGGSGIITALSVTESGIFAGTADGEVLHWPGGPGDKPHRLHRGAGRPVESLWLLVSQGVRRLFFTDTTGYVHAQVLGDSFACRYEAGGQTLRRVEVAPDLVAATNDLRDRLFLWAPGKPERPLATLPVGAMIGHSIQDVCLLRA
ncbi:MAG: hypothetical protein HY763_07525 [Planctomycetes bacterium]|nr:hypothetical protein [Planctomycetota bacterium]